MGQRLSADQQAGVVSRASQLSDDATALWDARYREAGAWLAQEWLKERRKRSRAEAKSASGSPVAVG